MLKRYQRSTGKKSWSKIYNLVVVCSLLQEFSSWVSIITKRLIYDVTKEKSEKRFWLRVPDTRLFSLHFFFSLLFFFNLNEIREICYVKINFLNEKVSSNLFDYFMTSFSIHHYNRRMLFRLTWLLYFNKKKFLSLLLITIIIFRIFHN